MDMTTMLPLMNTTFTAIEGRRWLGMNLTREESWDVYVTTRTTWQEGHIHQFEMPSEDGHSACTGCGATAWCLTWVKPALHCTPACSTHVRQTAAQSRCPTGVWVESMLDLLNSLVEQSAQHRLERELGAVCIDGPGVIPAQEVTAVLAALDPNERARPGIPVPTMVLGVTD